MNRNELCRKAAVTADVTITDAGRVIPPTEERISVPEAKSPVFKAGKVFRDVLNDRR